MNEQDREQEFIDNVKATMDESMERMDAHTLSQLRQARARAIESMQTREKRGRFVLWVPAGGFAVVSMSVLAVFLYFNTSNVTMPEGGLLDTDLIASSEGLDFYENLEFYEWLAAQETIINQQHDIGSAHDAG